MTARVRPSWQSQLHALWKSAFDAANTKDFAQELYLGLLSMPTAVGVLGARLAPNAGVKVVRWADSGGIRTAPEGLAAEVTEWTRAAHGQGVHLSGPCEITELTLADLRRSTPSLASRVAGAGATGLLVATFAVAGREHGLLAVALTRLPAPRELVVAVEQAIDVIVAADHRIKDQIELDDRAATDAILAEASLRLATSLDIHETLRSVVRMAVPGLADGAVVHLNQGDHMAPIAFAHVDARREHLLAEHVRAGRWAGTVVVDGTDRSSWDDMPRPSQLPAEVDLELMTTTVLRARGHDVGLLTFLHRDSTRRWPASEFLHNLAGRAALAIDNAGLYEQRREDVVSLQRHLLPSTLPHVDSLEFATGYHVGDNRLDVGGDFYGVVEQPDGTVTALIGDVCGRGAAAAALTGLARHTLETMLETGAQPAGAIQSLNTKLLRAKVERFLTLATATFGPVTAEGTPVTLLSAGHPPPFLVRRDGTVEEAACRGQLVGLLADPHLRPAHEFLRPGDYLILFTDGLVEARNADRAFFGETDIEETLSRLRDLPLSEIARTMVTGAGRYTVDDDAAVLVIRHRGNRALHLRLPAREAAGAALTALRRLRGDESAALPASITAFLEGAPEGEVLVTVDGDQVWTRVEVSSTDSAWGLV
ncbi:PP2C family protein-serine/threonine phosphatase [Allokutzneria sp. NRRL B-24872]|uniref:PP2C family protein-serine/threonine phosphatase n=1 Tax=Allokutzneria sp. NRRL B-24872 TaxID=1137961 RepID=UPI000A390CC5|nr:GAF domain-containing SpoIIE family protein phosphatase [Allokutzneria sp. NRRL B-24872]